MPREERIVTCSAPGDPHALDGIPVQPRTGALHRPCPKYLGRGQWNSEIDLVSQRSKRCVCDKCDGRGWIETGDDPVPSADIAISPDGRPEWIVRFSPSDDRE